MSANKRRRCKSDAEAEAYAQELRAQGYAVSMKWMPKGIVIVEVAS